MIADIRAQILIIAVLRAAFGHGITIVAEEDEVEGEVFGQEEVLQSISIEQVTADSSPRLVSLSEVCVFIDPLDGTREFVEGRLRNVQTLIGISLDGVVCYSLKAFASASTQMDTYFPPSSMLCVSQLLRQSGCHFGDGTAMV